MRRRCCLGRDIFLRANMGRGKMHYYEDFGGARRGEVGKRIGVRLAEKRAYTMTGLEGGEKIRVRYFARAWSFDSRSGLRLNKLILKIRRKTLSK